MDQIDVQLKRLIGVPLNKVSVIADYDLSIADKVDPANPDHSPLTPSNHRGLAWLSPQLNHLVVLTARGEESALAYLREHGSIDNASLASNSGHWWRSHFANNDAQPELIDVPGYEDDPALFKEVQTGIKSIIQLLSKLSDLPCYKEIQPSYRELCGAVIYQIDGYESPAHAAFLRAADEIKHRFDPQVAKHIVFEGKHFRPANGADETHGYIDFKPMGMDKGHTTRHILSQKLKIKKNDWVIAIGDSAPDLRIMQEARKLVTPDRFIGIAVGKNLVELDSDGVVNAHILANGHSAVDRLHLEFLQQIPKFAAPARQATNHALSIKRFLGLGNGNFS